ncbi:MAG TPA: Rrf2 family transcriptional regulator [Acidobacteriota bacterium]|jgi:Rrf2 family protein|nr:Rrf2 family transcriptional regulator [Acidobacteriota bacterium]
MITRKTKYSLNALMHLVRNAKHGPILISELAKKERIPKKFLELILLDLKNQGILKSKRGKGGGYSLARPPELIRVGQIIRMMEGPLAPIPCVSETAYEKCEDCMDEASCGIRKVMKEVRDASARILDNTTLFDLVSNSRKNTKKVKQ